MKNKLNKLGFKTTYLGKGSAENDKIEQGSYDFLFGSPEMCVGNQKWIDLLSSVYQNKLKLIVVDEAHTVIQWYFISFLLCCLINDINMIFNLST